MHLKASLFFLSVVSFAVFTYFSYIVAKETWQQLDFDTTVKLQDHVQRRFDGIFSYFSFLGSVEITIGAALILALSSFLRRKFSAFWGWLLILPASFFEVFGKLVIFHPAPPEFFHRSVLEKMLPSFYVHTNFSYPSGHMTRTIFLVVVIAVWIWVSRGKGFSKLLAISGLLVFAFLMGFTRIYLGEHWLSDVLGGSLLGLASGLFSSILIIRKNTGKIK